MGDARLTWAHPRPDGDEHTVRIETWSYVATDGSQHRDGTLVHIEFPLHDGTTGQLELDLPPPGPGALAIEYSEHKGARVLFDAQTVTGTVTVSDQNACDCHGGTFDLVFTDPGPDGELDTDDDQTRALRQGAFGLKLKACRAVNTDDPEDVQAGQVRLAFVDSCSSASAGFGGGPRAPTQVVPDRHHRWNASGDRHHAPRYGWNTGQQTTVVVVATDPTPYPYDDEPEGCSCDSSAGRDDSHDSGGCGDSTDSGQSSGGCESDDDGSTDSTGCGGDDDDTDGGCGSRDGGSGGCEGDDDYAHAAHTDGGGARCRRRPRSLLAGPMQSYLMIGAAAALPSLTRRRKRTPSRHG